MIGHVPTVGMHTQRGEIEIERVCVCERKRERERERERERGRAIWWEHEIWRADSVPTYLPVFLEMAYVLRGEGAGTQERRKLLLDGIDKVPDVPLHFRQLVEMCLWDVGATVRDPAALSWLSTGSVLVDG